MNQVDGSALPRAKKWLKKNIHTPDMGWVCKGDVSIGPTPLETTQNNDWSMVHILLRQKMLRSALIVCSLEEILQKGLPVDKADFICMHDIEVPVLWLPVFKAATPCLRVFEDMNVLFSFSLGALLD